MFYCLLCAFVVTIVSMKSFAKAFSDREEKANEAKYNLTKSMFVKHLGIHWNKLALAPDSTELAHVIFNNKFISPLVLENFFKILDNNKDDSLTFDELHCAFDGNNAEPNDRENQIKVIFPEVTDPNERTEILPLYELNICFRQALKRRYFWGIGEEGDKAKSALITGTVIGDVFKFFDDNDNKEIDQVDLHKHLNLWIKGTLFYTRNVLQKHFAAYLDKDPNKKKTFRFKYSELKNEKQYDEWQASLNQFEMEDSEAREKWLEGSSNPNPRPFLKMAWLRSSLTMALTHLDNTDTDYFKNYKKVKAFLADIRTTLDTVEEAVFKLVDQESDGDIDEHDFQNWKKFFLHTSDESAENVGKCKKKLKEFFDFLKEKTDPIVLTLIRKALDNYSVFIKNEGAAGDNAIIEFAEENVKQFTQILSLWKYERVGGQKNTSSLDDFIALEDVFGKYFTSKASTLLGTEGESVVPEVQQLQNNFYYMTYGLEEEDKRRKAYLVAPNLTPAAVDRKEEL